MSPPVSSSPPSSPVSATQGAVAGIPCPCQGPCDPQVITNPPAAPSISYRVDDFTGFRRALLRALPGETALGAWRPVPGDLGLQVLEWWAYLGDILTFYNERVANEDYLRTAQFPASVAGLVALLGYQLAPGVAATGQVAAVRNQSHPTEPLVLPQWMQISSAATAGVPAQIFEVTAPSSFSGATNVTATLAPDPNLDATTTGPNSVLLSGKVTAAKVGDQLVLVAAGWAGGDDDWSLATVASVAPETDPGTGAVNTRVTFGDATWGTLEPAAAPTDETVDRRESELLEVFRAGLEATVADRDDSALLWWLKGRTTPSSPSALVASSYQLLRPTAAASLWAPTGTDVSPTAAVSTDGSLVNLSSTNRAIHPRDLVLFDGGTATASVLAMVTATSDRTGTKSFPETLSPPAPDILMPFTAIGVASNDGDSVAAYSSDPTVVTVRYGFRPVGTVIANPRGTVPSLPVQVQVPTSFSLPTGVTAAFLVDANASAALVGVAPDGTGQLALTAGPNTPSTFDPPLAVPLTVYLDLVPVARGVTVASETLGSGTASVANQSFALQNSPLTYLADGADRVSTLSVYVDGVEWTEVATLYGQSATAQVYVVELAPDQTATVRFGDGITGSRLTTGTGNVVATYRYGSGLASPPSGRLTTAINSQPNLASIQNPVAVTGGADPQAPADVKADAPASVLCFGRAISADDYEVVAGQASGVTRVRAYWTFDPTRQRNLVKIYVNNDAGGVGAAQAALAGADDPNRPVVVAAAIPIDVSISCTLIIDPSREIDDVVAVATTSVSDPSVGAFSPSMMGIGQWLYRSYIEAALSVPGVLGVHSLRVTWLTVPSGPEQLRILNVLNNVAAPGEGAFFDLSPSVNIGGSYSDG